MPVMETKSIASGTHVTISTELRVVCCHTCTGIYAIALPFANRRLQDGGTWHCPYCRQGTVYSASENAQLKKQLEEKDRALRWQNEQRVNAQRESQSLRRQRDGMKGVLVREQKRLARVKNGVCPCCNRHFANLERHMKTKHEGSL